MIVFNDNLVDTETGEILERNVSKMGYEELGRLMWTKYRHLYESQRIGEPNKDEYEYRDNDNGISFKDDCRTWKENKAIVKSQIDTETAKAKARTATAIKTPSDLSKRASRWWETFINGGYMRRGKLKHRNGKPLTKEYMAGKMKVSIDTIERAIRELSDKGYITKEQDFYRMDIEAGTAKTAGTATKRTKGRTAKPMNLTEVQKRIWDRLT